MHQSPLEVHHTHLKNVSSVPFPWVSLQPLTQHFVTMVVAGYVADICLHNLEKNKSYCYFDVLKLA